MTEKIPELLGLLQNIIDSSIDGILAFDKEYRYTIWNDSMIAISGKTKAETLGKVSYEVFPFLKTIGEIEYFTRALQGEVVRVTDRPFEVPESRKEGYFEAVYSPIYDGADRVIGGLGVIRDTTEQRQFRKALEESESRHRSLTQFATDAIISCDEQGKILSWNNGAAQMFDYSEAEILGQPFDKLVPGEFWREYLRQARLSSPDLIHKGSRAELTGYRKHGSSIPLEITLSSWKRGDHFFLSAVIRDITDRRHLEIQAEERHEFQHALMRAQSDLGEGVAVIDIVEGRLLHANDALTRMLGYTQEEMKSMSDLWVLAAPEQVELAKKRVLSRARSGESSEYYELVAMRKDGSRLPVDLAVKTVETSDGFSVVVLVRDISARKLTESALQESERIKMRLSELNQNVIATVSVDGILTSLSPTFDLLTEIDPNQWIGKNFVSLCHPDNQAPVRDCLEKVFDGKTCPLYRIKIVTEGGNWGNFEVFSSPKFQEGRVGGAFLILRDITQELLKEQAVYDEKQRFKALVETTSEGITVVENGVIIEANSTFARMFGYGEAKEVVGMKPPQFVVPEYAKVVENNVKEGHQGKYRMVGLRKDGTTFSGEVHGKNFIYQGREIRVASVRELPG
jgi:PAS domain S-box-containing protein